MRPNIPGAALRPTSAEDVNRRRNVGCISRAVIKEGGAGLGAEVLAGDSRADELAGIGFRCLVGRAPRNRLVGRIVGASADRAARGGPAEDGAVRHLGRRVDAGAGAGDIRAFDHGAVDHSLRTVWPDYSVLGRSVD